jgi:hypothetical protein
MTPVAHAHSQPARCRSTTSRALLTPLVLLLPIAACASAPPPAPVLVPEGSQVSSGRDAPEWVLRTPRMRGNICAVGAVDPTFFRQDGIASAAEAARNELARTVQVKINSVFLDVAENDGSWVRQVIDSTTEVVLSGAEVLEYWHDERGTVQRRGMTWALACMKTDQSVAELAAKLKEAAETVPEDEPTREAKIAKVRERAAAAFDELEAAEAKAAAR